MQNISETHSASSAGNSDSSLIRLQLGHCLLSSDMLVSRGSACVSCRPCRSSTIYQQAIAVDSGVQLPVSSLKGIAIVANQHA